MLGIYHETQKKSPKVVCEVKKEYEEERRNIKVLHSDNDGEYTSDLFLQLCHDKGKERHFTVRKTPQ